MDFEAVYEKTGSKAELKKEKYYKNIKKVMLFSSRIEYNSYCMIKLDDNTNTILSKYHKLY